MVLVHGTCVALDGQGILFVGPSGSGKSDLALRMIDGGAQLVADDQVEITADEDGFSAGPPQAIAGRMEVRGIGIVRLDWCDACRLRLAVELLGDEKPERLPASGAWRHGDIVLPSIRIAPFEASAPAKVRLAVRSNGHDSAHAPNADARDVAKRSDYSP